MTIRKLIAPSLLALGLAAGLTACSPKDTGTSTSAHTENTAVKKVSKPELGTFGIELANMDKSIKPGDNFFKYVNGAWLDKTEIPADKSNYGSAPSRPWPIALKRK